MREGRGGGGGEAEISWMVMIGSPPSTSNATMEEPPMMLLALVQQLSSGCLALTKTGRSGSSVWPASGSCLVICGTVGQTNGKTC